MQWQVAWKWAPLIQVSVTDDNGRETENPSPKTEPAKLIVLKKRIINTIFCFIMYCTICSSIYIYIPSMSFSQVPTVYACVLRIIITFRNLRSGETSLIRLWVLS